MSKILSKKGIIYKCLEDYENRNPYERDKNMAKRFLDIINEN